MEKIYAKLEELGLSEEQLPKEIQNLINGLDEKIEGLNAQIEDLEAQGATEEQINEQTEEEDTEIEEIEEDIVETIVGYHASISRGTQGGQGTGGQGAYVAPQNLGKQPTKDSKGGDGWMIFGALALVVTLGAVNMFKK
jgi:hypothetical protein